MTQDNTSGQVIERLTAVLATSAISDKVRTTGEGLIKRLSAPIRVTLLGLPGQGKTSVLNGLIGHTLLPEGAGLPTYELHYSDSAYVVATRADGTTVRAADLTFQALMDMAAVFLQIYLPLDILKQIRLMEVVTDNDPRDLSAAIKWAMRRTDIGLWCSRTFTAPERAFWAQVPEGLKDHGYLVLTDHDATSATALVRSNMAVADQFHMVMPVAKFCDSNGERSNLPLGFDYSKLRSELLRHIDLGRQADVDHALMFLSRFEKTRTVGGGNAKKAEHTNLGQIVQITSLPDAAVQTECFANAANYLRDQAMIMLTDIEEFGSDAARPLLDRCLETANNLVEMLADEPPITDRQELAAEAAVEAADLLLLMTMENQLDAAEDAVNLLLQVKRDFELAVAA